MEAQRGQVTYLSSHSERVVPLEMHTQAVTQKPFTDPQVWGVSPSARVEPVASPPRKQQVAIRPQATLQGHTQGTAVVLAH